MEYKLTLDDFVSPKIIGYQIQVIAHGGALMGGLIGYKRKGDIELPAEGGKVKLILDEVKYDRNIGREKITDERHLYSMVCDFPKEAVFWYKKMDPKISPWDAPIDNFEIEIPDENKIPEEKIRDLLSKLR
ncbi:hypothetical protein GF336_06795 [Candidatus Woesearchaeota archaeon]|nr:hypothetical protein [Candidatus Woesearchaeota archaeon]